MVASGKVLQKLTTTIETRKKSLEAKWLKLVRDCCDGKVDGPEEVEAILKECDKSVDELRTACGKIETRRAKCVEIAEYEAAKPELPRIAAAIQAAGTELDATIKAAREKYAGVLKPLREREETIQQMRKSADQARQYLSNSFDDAAAIEREAELKHRRAELLQKRNTRFEVAMQKDQLEKDWARNLEQRKGEYCSADESSKIYKKNRIAEAERAVASCNEQARKIREEELPSIDQELSEVDAELQRIEARRFQP